MNPQPLTIDAVRNIAEELMTKHGNTTTLDVKNLLRNRNYFATQQEVSAHMDTLTRTDSWKYSQKTGYRVYSLPADTNNIMDEYYYNGSEVMEVYVRDKEFHLGIGVRYGQVTYTTKYFQRNSSAISEAKKVVAEYKQKGFVANNNVPTYQMRLQYRSALNEKPEKVKIGVYNFLVTYQYEAENNQISENDYSVGGYFSWEKNDFKQLSDNIKNKNWDLGLFQKGNFVLNGKKLISKNISPKILNTNIAQNEFVKITPQIGNIYEATFITNTGKNITINQYNEINQQDFMEKVKSILENGLVFF
jgi:predicted DNA-binding WGR domain protein